MSDAEYEFKVEEREKRKKRLLSFSAVALAACFFIGLLLLSNIAQVAAAEQKNLVKTGAHSIAISSYSSQRNVVLVNGWYVYFWIDNASRNNVYTRTSQDGSTWGHEQLSPLQGSETLLAAGMDVDCDGYDYVFVGVESIPGTLPGTVHYYWARGLVNNDGSITWDARSTVYTSGAGAYDAQYVAVGWNAEDKMCWFASGMDWNVAAYYLHIYSSSNNGSSWDWRLQTSAATTTPMNCRYVNPVICSTSSDDVWIFAADYTNAGIHYWKWDGSGFELEGGKNDRYHALTNGMATSHLKFNEFSAVIDINNIVWFSYVKTGGQSLYQTVYTTGNNTWGAESQVDTATATYAFYPSIGSDTDVDKLHVYAKDGVLYSRKFLSTGSFEAAEATWGNSFSTPIQCHVNKQFEVPRFHVSWQESGASTPEFYLGFRGPQLTTISTLSETYTTTTSTTSSETTSTILSQTDTTTTTSGKSTSTTTTISGSSTLTTTTTSSSGTSTTIWISQTTSVVGSTTGTWINTRTRTTLTATFPRTTTLTWTWTIPYSTTITETQTKLTQVTSSTRQSSKTTTSLWTAYSYSGSSRSSTTTYLSGTTTNTFSTTSITGTSTITTTSQSGTSSFTTTSPSTTQTLTILSTVKSTLTDTRIIYIVEDTVTTTTTSVTSLQTTTLTSVSTSLTTTTLPTTSISTSLTTTTLKETSISTSLTTTTLPTTSTSTSWTTETLPTTSVSTSLTTTTLPTTSIETSLTTTTLPTTSIETSLTTTSLSETSVSTSLTTTITEETSVSTSLTTTTTEETSVSVSTTQTSTTLIQTLPITTTLEETSVSTSLTTTTLEETSMSTSFTGTTTTEATTETELETTTLTTGTLTSTLTEWITTTVKFLVRPSGGSLFPIGLILGFGFFFLVFFGYRMIANGRARETTSTLMANTGKS